MFASKKCPQDISDEILISLTPCEEFVKFHHTLFVYGIAIMHKATSLRLLYNCPVLIWCHEYSEHSGDRILIIGDPSIDKYKIRGYTLYSEYTGDQRMCSEYTGDQRMYSEYTGDQWMHSECTGAQKIYTYSEYTGDQRIYTYSECTGDQRIYTYSECTGDQRIYTYSECTGDQRIYTYSECTGEQRICTYS